MSEGTAPIAFEAARAVYLIGKIDREKYGNLATDEVVLTPLQKEHIQEKREKTYQKYKEQLAEILADPDYILEDPKHEETVLVFKRFTNFAEIVLRLSTGTGDKKNSIITLWEIKEARMQRYIFTHKTLYKREYL